MAEFLTGLILGAAGILAVTGFMVKGWQKSPWQPFWAKILRWPVKQLNP